MNRGMLLLSGVALVMIAAAAGSLTYLSGHQSLAPPGVKTHPLESSIRLVADLPEHVLDYQSKLEETEEVVLGTLPPDTSFGRRSYKAPDGFALDMRVVLMGRDRTSMHKPQICLPGHGLQIDDLASGQANIRVERPYPYDLPVVKLITNGSTSSDGQIYRGIYVYWYVASDALSASTTGFQRMWLMASRLLRTGVLQRWAYVSCFAVCVPGQENATYDRMRQFIAAAVPQFQLYPGPQPQTITAAR